MIIYLVLIQVTGIYIWRKKMAQQKKMIIQVNYFISFFFFIY